MRTLFGRFGILVNHRNHTVYLCAEEPLWGTSARPLRICRSGSNIKTTMNKHRPTRSRGPQGTRIINQDEIDDLLEAEENAAPQDSGPAPSVARITVLNNAGDAIGTATLPGQRTLIGRDAGCNIRLRSSTVSSMHASISRKANRWWILNYISSNGTYVNDRKVKEAVLNPGDRIRLGGITMVFDYPEQPRGFFSRLWKRLAG